MKFRKRPVIIDAYQWNGDFDGVVSSYLSPAVPEETECPECKKAFYRQHGWIETLEGPFRVCPGDWVITGVKGENYPCKPDIFELTYEAAE